MQGGGGGKHVKRTIGINLRTEGGKKEEKMEALRIKQGKEEKNQRRKEEEEINT